MRRVHFARVFNPSDIDVN